MDVLRNEIIEAQKHRSDLLKWKLLLVAGLGAAGLSIGSFATQGAPPNASGSSFQPELLLCLIPFVCLYVDFLCRHLNLRMSVIGYFLRFSSGQSQGISAYEEFCCSAQEDLKIFSLERAALQISSYVLSLLVLLYGLDFTSIDKWTGWILVVSGVLGLFSSMFARVYYDRKSEELKNYAKSRLQAKGYSINLLIL